MAKKELNKVKKNKINIDKTSSNNEVSKIIKIISAIIAIFIVVYFATDFITKRNLNETEEEVQIQKVEILMGETFEKTDSEYMIVYYDFEEKNYANLYAMLVDNYNSKNNKVPMYKVNLATKFSEKYMATEEEKSNTKPTSLSNLKVKGATLIRIKDKKVVKYIEGKDNIKTYIDGLMK